MILHPPGTLKPSLAKRHTDRGTCKVSGRHVSQALNLQQKGFKKQLIFSAREMKNKLDSQGRVAIYGIHFDFDKADLKPGSEKVLLEMVKLMKNNPGLDVEIQGHTDNVGQRGYNQQLSEQRAMTVRSFLSLYGIAPERMTVRGFGPDRPVAGNRTEEGRTLNRRVELKKL